MVDMGKLIKEKVEASKMPKTEFARQISRTSQNVHDLFKRKTIDSELLAKIGEVLGYDFFQHYRKPLRNKEELGQIAEAATANASTQTRQTVSLVVELDGTEASENKWVKMIRDINLVVRSNR